MIAGRGCRAISADMVGSLATSMASQVTPEREDLRKRLSRVANQAG
jgi:hypothetical protein